MSRSRKKTPVCGLYFCSSYSEKEEKRIWHRRMRAAVLVRLHDADPDEVVLPHEHEIFNVWGMTKDGKQRFNPREHPKLMRKQTKAPRLSTEARRFRISSPRNF